MIKNKTLLVLAASTYQLPVIKTAKQLGYRVVTTDNIPSNPGHALADVSYKVDTTDREAVLKIAEAENVSGVIAAGTDVAVITAAYIAEHLGIPGIPYTSSQILTSKQAFRGFQQQLGLPCPRAFHIADKMLPDGIDFSGKSWLIKPCKASGSRGVFIVSEDSEYFNRVSESLNNSMDNTAVLEEFINGSQHTCEGILNAGKVVLSLLTDRYTEMV